MVQASEVRPLGCFLRSVLMGVRMESIGILEVGRQEGPGRGRDRWEPQDYEAKLCLPWPRASMLVTRASGAPAPVPHTPNLATGPPPPQTVVPSREFLFTSHLPGSWLFPELTTSPQPSRGGRPSILSPLSRLLPDAAPDSSPWVSH